MRKYRREFKFRRVHKSIWGAVALLLVFSFLLQNVAGSAYYSLLMEPDTMVTSPPVELQEGTAVNSTSTIYTNKTSALVSVEPSGTGGTDVEDYVGNNTSDVDSSADKGTHGNFTAQQYGPDLINDTLTEENMGGTGNDTMLLYVNADDETRTQWTRVGTSPYLDAIDYSTNYVWVSGNNKLGGDFDFEDPGRSWGAIYNVTVQVYAQQSQSNDLEVFVWDGSVWTTLGVQTLTTSWRWENYTAATVLDTWTKIDGAKIYLKSKAAQGTYEVDVARLKVDYNDSDNYELDLEVQWAAVDYDEPYEVLGLYGGTMGAENIRVDVWYNSAWQNVFTDLSSGWNNVSVGSYLDSSNFTIRFKGAAETGDTTQTTWDIDAALLHVWSGTETLGNATTVTTNATSRAVSYGKDRAVLRTTDANNTLHVFQIDSNNNLQWWKSTNNGTTWSKQISSGFGAVDHFSVKKDSSNYIHIAYASGTGSVYYRKQLYNATSWGGSVTISSNGDSYQPDVAIAPYNNSWVYVVYDDHAGAPVHNEVWVRNSTNGGTSFGGPVELTYNGFSYTGTFPSIVIDNTLGIYGHVYVTWYRGQFNLYLRRGNITSTGTVNWDGDSNVQTISSGMSAIITENTNMMHSAMYTNGKYRVVYVESGTAKYRDWDESSWSSPISLATVSHYPSITYDWDNYIYVFYHTDDSNANYDIRYQKSADTTPTSFLSARNVTANNDGNRYVSAKLGGDNNRVEFAWTNGTSSYGVEFNYLEEGAAAGPGQGNFNYVLKFVEKDNSNWKVRLKAYDQSNIGRLDNLTIYIYDGSNSTQIVILNGLYDQQNGSWYDLNALDTEYIWMHVETSSAGTSYVYAYLEILVPNTTTYAQYIITFKIT